MTALHIQVPDELMRFAREQAAARGCESAEQYVVELLIREAHANEGPDDWDEHPDELEKLIEEGLASGPAEPFEPGFFNNLKAKLIAKYGPGTRGR